MRNPDWTPDRIASALELEGEGLSREDIARAVNKQFGTAFTRASVSGVISRNRSDASRYQKILWGAEITARAVGLWMEGHTAQHVAETINGQFGTTHSANAVIGKLNREMGSTRRRRFAPKTLAPDAPTVRSCQWPTWPHGDRPTHEYCGEPVARREDGTRLPYCAAHWGKATRQVASKEAAQ